MPPINRIRTKPIKLRKPLKKDGDNLTDDTIDYADEYTDDYYEDTDGLVDDDPIDDGYVLEPDENNSFDIVDQGDEGEDPAIVDYDYHNDSLETAMSEDVGDESISAPVEEFVESYDPYDPSYSFEDGDGSYTIDDNADTCEPCEESVEGAKGGEARCRPLPGKRRKRRAAKRDLEDEFLIVLAAQKGAKITMPSDDTYDPVPLDSDDIDIPDCEKLEVTFGRNKGRIPPGGGQGPKKLKQVTGYLVEVEKDGVCEIHLDKVPDGDCPGTGARSSILLRVAKDNNKIKWVTAHARPKTRKAGGEVPNPFGNRNICVNRKHDDHGPKGKIESVSYMRGDLAILIV